MLSEEDGVGGGKAWPLPVTMTWPCAEFSKARGPFPPEAPSHPEVSGGGGRGGDTGAQTAPTGSHVFGPQWDRQRLAGVVYSPMLQS